jgi:type II secretory pathway predicted ATPase ExeA
MYESFFGFSEKPFSLRPDPSYLYLGEEHSMALAVFNCGLLNEAGFTVITGEIGAGKTTLIRHVLSQVRANVTLGIISNTHHSFGNLLQWVLAAFELDYKHKEKVDLYQTFVAFLDGEYAAGRRTVLVIDEAQNLDADTLEELRVLSNVNADKDQVLQVVLVGQPELRDALRRPNMRQFAQRIAVAYHLKALDYQETENCIRHRLTIAGGNPLLFNASACKSIYEYSQGIPRVINVLCDTALIYAFAEQRREIGADLIEKVVRDRDLDARSSGRIHSPSIAAEVVANEADLAAITEHLHVHTERDKISEASQEAVSPPSIEDLRMLFGGRGHKP